MLYGVKENEICGEKEWSYISVFFFILDNKYCRNSIKDSWVF